MQEIIDLGIFRWPHPKPQEPGSAPRSYVSHKIKKTKVLCVNPNLTLTLTLTKGQGTRMRPRIYILNILMYTPYSIY